MKFEESCGAVVFTRCGAEIRYVLIRSLEGVYGFDDFKLVAVGGHGCLLRPARKGLEP